MQNLIFDGVAEIDWWVVQGIFFIIKHCLYPFTSNLLPTAHWKTTGTTFKNALVFFVINLQDSPLIIRTRAVNGSTFQVKSSLKTYPISKVFDFHILIGRIETGVGALPICGYLVTELAGNFLAAKVLWVNQKRLVSFVNAFVDVQFVVA